MNENFVITIARGFGSGGKEIGAKLAKELGIQCYERRIPKLAAEYSGLNERLFYQVDEKLRGNFIKNILKKAPKNPGILRPEEKSFESDLSLFHMQANIIRELARTESCVVVGKCANHILKEFDNVISIYIEAPRKDCLAMVMDKMEVTEKKANQIISKTDKYRADYYKYYTGGDYWTNPTSYDLTINTGRVGKEKSVELIRTYLKLKLGH